MRVFPALFPTALFATIGIHNLSHIGAAAGARGITFTSGMGMTVGRVGFGAFPLACALFLAGCLFSDGALIAAFALVATLDTVVLIVRLASMLADSSVQDNMPLVRAEVLLMALAVTGLLVEFGRRRRLGASSMPKGRNNLAIEKQ